MHPDHGLSGTGSRGRCTRAVADGLALGGRPAGLDPGCGTGLRLPLRLCGALSLTALTPCHPLLAHIHLGTLTPGDEPHPVGLGTPPRTGSDRAGSPALHGVVDLPDQLLEDVLEEDDAEGDARGILDAP